MSRRSRRPGRADSPEALLRARVEGPAAVVEAQRRHIAALERKVERRRWR